MGPSKAQYAERLPSHHCAECSQVVYLEDPFCPECGAATPGDGWPSIQDGFDPWLGRVLDGRYVITRRIGQGAMSKVYRADSMAIARHFAVKIINFHETSSGVDGEQVRARLHREIEATGRLRNPHVVPFYEVLELFDHFVGVVMDYVSGVTLQAVVDVEGPLSMRRAVKILRQVANGVHEAHEVGMIHRDLKPDNIMVERLPAGDDFVHVLDFGIVQLDDGVSMTHGFLGTPLYASPEQAMAGTVDRRSDIYSLGTTLFFMLTGRTPFASDNVYEILQAHVRRPPPTLSDVTGGYPFPAELEGLVADMLAKSPTKRPETLEHVIRRLDQMLQTNMLEGDPARSSQELIAASGHATLSRSVHGTEPSGLGESSSSVFESTERDETGPKAAIFRRGASRGSVRQLIDRERADNRTEFDRVFNSNTGTHTLGIEVPVGVCRGACSPEGDLLLGDDAGHLTLIREGEPRSVGAVDGLRSFAINARHALVGDATGQVWEVTETGLKGLLGEDRDGAAAITAIGLGPRSRLWFAGAESGRVYECKPDRSKNVWIRILEGPPVAALALSEMGDVFAVARRHGEIEVCSVSRPKEPYARFSVPGGDVRALAFSRDGHLIASLLDDKTIAVHLIEGGRRVHTLRDEQNDLLTLSFRGDELLGYFQSDGRMYARKLEREWALSPR